MELNMFKLHFNSLHYSWWNLTCLCSILTPYITTHLSNSWPAFVCVTQFCGAQCQIFAFLPEFWAGRAGMSNLKEKEWFFSLWPPFTWNVMFKRTRSRPVCEPLHQIQCMQCIRLNYKGKAINDGKGSVHVLYWIFHHRGRGGEKAGITNFKVKN